MTLAEEWRPLQFFLESDPLAVAEVQARHHTTEDGDELLIFRCTCKEFKTGVDAEPCKHVVLVMARIRLLGGTYITRMRRADIDPEMLMAAARDPQKHRELMLHESEIEVLSDGEG